MHAKLFNEELTLFKNTFRRWLNDEVVPHHAAWERAGLSPREIYKKAGANGFLLITGSPEFGGQGLDFRFSALLTEELALAGATGVPFWLHSDIIAPYIGEFGTTAQKKKWLPLMASGEVISAIAMTEPGAGSDLQGMRTSAIRKGDKWIINGAKTFISNGINADLVIVAAVTTSTEKTKYAPISLFVVERGAPGFEKSKPLEKIGLKAQDTAELNFSNCEVPAENLLGEVGKGFLYLTKNLAVERLLMAIHAVAASRRALDLTLRYAKERHAFGKAIAEFQNTRFKLADLATEIEFGQAFVDQCVVDLLDKKDITVAASMAKAKTTEVLGRVTDECLQFFGGYGYMAEYPISHAYADARAWRLFGGTTEIMKEIIARSLFSPR